MKTNLNIEITHTKSIAVSIRRQDWPQTRHYVLAIGRTEARVIVPHEVSVSPVRVATMLGAALMIGMVR